MASLAACGALLAIPVALASPVAIVGDQHGAPTKPEKPAAAPPKTPPAPATKPTKPATKPAEQPEAKPTPATEAAPHGEAKHDDPHDQHDAHDAKPATDAHADPHAAPAAAAHGSDAPSVSPDEALRRLVEGNARFAHDIDNTTPRDIKRRSELAGGQHPFAIVLACADSRVPPELVFDQELGDLFVVRVAGNTADDAVLGSMEYAIDHLGSKLVVVLGHTKCGAVKTAVDTAGAGKQASDLPGHLPAIVSSIMPAVAETHGSAGDPVSLAVVRNVQRTVNALRQCGPIIAEACTAKGVRVVGAVYDIQSGQVDFVPELSPSASQPAQAQTAGAEHEEHVEH